MAESIIAPPVSQGSEDNDIETMSHQALVELHEQIAGEAMDVTARMKLLADLAIEKLPNTTDEDDSRYALQLLLDQFALDRATANRMYELCEQLLSRIEPVAGGVRGGTR